MRRPSLRLVALVALAIGSLGAGAGCSASKDDTGGNPILTKDSGTSTTDSGTSTQDSDLAPPDDSGGLNADIGNQEVGTSGCKATDDCDGDGYKTAVDCDDKDSTINPEAYDFVGDMVDNDCDGTADNPVTSCAATNPSKPNDAINFARALDLCPQISKNNAGKVYDPVVSATWPTISSGLFSMAAKPAQYGRLAKFGDNAARNGADLVAISTGTLGDGDPRTGANTTINSVASIQNPCGAIPLKAVDCPSLTNGAGSSLTLTANDYAELKLQVKVPTNANAMLLDFSFFSTEFNEFWKSQFNDGFFVLVTSKKLQGTNVAKDANNMGITVNSGFFQLCPSAATAPSDLEPNKAKALTNCVGQPTDPTGKIFGSLTGTGFAGELLPTPSTDDTTMGLSTTTAKFVYGGASGWLSTKFGVTPGETLVIRFIIFDTGDSALDSAVILDNIRWEKAPPATVDPVVERPPS